jgi:CheY-like chemotaxis protein
MSWCAPLPRASSPSSAIAFAAEDARAAIEMMDHGCAPDLLFTDVIMPGGMNGRELAEHLHRRHPGLKVLYTSDNAHGAVTREPVGAAQVRHLLGKPYRRHDLATNVLDEPAAA